MRLGKETQWDFTRLEVAVKYSLGSRFMTLKRNTNDLKQLNTQAAARAGSTSAALKNSLKGLIRLHSETRTVPNEQVIGYFE